MVVPGDQMADALDRQHAVGEVAGAEIAEEADRQREQPLHDQRLQARLPCAIPAAPGRSPSPDRSRQRRAPPRRGRRSPPQACRAPPAARPFEQKAGGYGCQCAEQAAEQSHGHDRREIAATARGRSGARGRKRADLRRRWTIEGDRFRLERLGDRWRNAGFAAAIDQQRATAAVGQQRHRRMGLGDMADQRAVFRRHQFSRSSTGESRSRSGARAAAGSSAADRRAADWSAERPRRSATMEKAATKGAASGAVAARVLRRPTRARRWIALDMVLASRAARVAQALLRGARVPGQRRGNGCCGEAVERGDAVAQIGDRHQLVGRERARASILRRAGRNRQRAGGVVIIGASPVADTRRNRLGPRPHRGRHRSRASAAQSVSAPGSAITTSGQAAQGRRRPSARPALIQ